VNATARDLEARRLYLELRALGGVAKTRPYPDAPDRLQLGIFWSERIAGERAAREPLRERIRAVKAEMLSLLVAEEIQDPAMSADAKAILEEGAA
jgi:hypothetical protein